MWKLLCYWHALSHVRKVTLGTSLVVVGGLFTSRAIVRVISVSNQQKAITANSAQFKAICDELKDIIDKESAVKFTQRLLKTKQYETIYLLFVHDFTKMNDVVQMLEKEDGRKFMEHIRLQESLVTPKTAKLFHQQKIESTEK